MPQETPSPLDLPVQLLEEGGSLGWASGTIAVASLVLLLTNAASIADWIDDRPPGPWQARCSAMADGWVSLTDQIGLGAPRAALHQRWKRAEASRFPTVASPVNQGSPATAGVPELRAARS